MEFGLLKTKVEKKLLEQYNTKNFKTELKIFQKIVLENKKISQLFFLYDELSSNKGLDTENANDFINECVKIYENNVNKLTIPELKKVISWTKDIKANNEYQTIDNFFNTDVLKLESKVVNKKIILENLKKIEYNKSEKNIILPIKTLVNIANNSIQKYIQNLDENTKDELKKILSFDNKKLSKDYNDIKIEVLDKLVNLKLNSDNETSQRIDESILKIKNEKLDKLNYFRLKSLNENI